MAGFSAVGGVDSGCSGADYASVGAIVSALTAWGREQGAVGACLEVEADNAPARALYDAIGLKRELYRYHYRREPANTVVTKM